MKIAAIVVLAAVAYIAVVYLATHMAGLNESNEEES